MNQIYEIFTLTFTPLPNTSLKELDLIQSRPTQLTKLAEI